jgi:hypothetical protein
MLPSSFNNLTPSTIVRTRKSTKAVALVVVEPTSFLMLWPDKLKTALINILRRYIKGGKLAENVFKKPDYIAIAVELQPIYVSLRVGPSTNIITST